MRPNIARCGLVGSAFIVSEPEALEYVNDASRRRFSKEWKHRLRDGDDCEHIRLEHRAHLVKSEHS